MTWDEVKEGDVLEWPGLDDELWLVLDARFLDVGGRWTLRLRILNLYDAEVMMWDRLWSALAGATLECDSVTLWSRAEP